MYREYQPELMPFEDIDDLRNKRTWSQRMVWLFILGVVIGGCLSAPLSILIPMAVLLGVSYLVYLHDEGNVTYEMNCCGLTPLHLAVKSGDVSRVYGIKNRLGQASHHNRRDLNGDTPLHYAARCNDEKARQEMFDALEPVKHLFHIHITQNYSVKTPFEEMPREEGNKYKARYTEIINDYELRCLPQNKAKFEDWRAGMFGECRRRRAEREARQAELIGQSRHEAKHSQ